MVMVPDITHEAYAVDYALAYVCSAINTHGSFAGDNGKIILNTFKEAMILPARAQRKADSEKKVISRNKINVYSRLLPIYVPTGHKAIASRWVHKNTHKGPIVVIGWGSGLVLIVDNQLPNSASSRVSEWGR